MPYGISNHMPSKPIFGVNIWSDNIYFLFFRELYANLSYLRIYHKYHSHLSHFMIKVSRTLFPLQRHQVWCVTENTRTKQSWRHCGTMLFGRETLPISNHRHLQINKAIENLVSDCYCLPFLPFTRFGFFKFSQLLGSGVRNWSGSESSCAMWASKEPQWSTRERTDEQQGAMKPSGWTHRGTTPLKQKCYCLGLKAKQRHWSQLALQTGCNCYLY